MKLVLDELEDQARRGACPAKVKKILESLPRNLDGFYAHMLESRLLREGAEMQTSALTMLQWVTYASRPLSRFELSEAVAIAESDSHDISVNI